MVTAIGIMEVAARCVVDVLADLVTCDLESPNPDPDIAAAKPNNKQTRRGILFNLLDSLIIWFPLNLWPPSSRNEWFQIPKDAAQSEQPATQLSSTPNKCGSQSGCQTSKN